MSKSSRLKAKHQGRLQMEARGGLRAHKQHMHDCTDRRGGVRVGFRRKHPHTSHDNHNLVNVHHIRPNGAEALPSPMHEC